MSRQGDWTFGVVYQGPRAGLTVWGFPQLGTAPDPEEPETPTAGGERHWDRQRRNVPWQQYPMRFSGKGTYVWSASPMASVTTEPAPGAGDDLVLPDSSGRQHQGKVTVWGQGQVVRVRGSGARVWNPNLPFDEPGPLPIPIPGNPGGPYPSIAFRRRRRE